MRPAPRYQELQRGALGRDVWLHFSVSTLNQRCLMSTSSLLAQRRPIWACITFCNGIFAALTLVPTVILSVFDNVTRYYVFGGMLWPFIALALLFTTCSAILHIPAGIGLWRGSRQVAMYVQILALLWTLGFGCTLLDSVLVAARPIHGIMIIGFIWPVVLLSRYQRRRAPTQNQTPGAPQLPPVPRVSRSTRPASPAPRRKRPPAE